MARKTVGRLLLGLLVVGITGAIVYGFCSLIVVQVGSSGADPATGRVFLYESTGHGGRVIVRYVTHAFHLTSTISGYIAAITLGVPLAISLLVLFADTVRLLIPGRYEPANFELARYRKVAGIDGITEEGLRYVAEWRDFARRRSFFLCWVASLVLPLLLGLRVKFGISGVLGWIVALIVLTVWHRSFRCPRCGERFSGRRRAPVAPPFCTNCGLPKDAAPTTAVARDFDEWKKRAMAPAASATGRYRGRSRR